MECFVRAAQKQEYVSRHMGHLETNLSIVYVQNSRIQARSGENLSIWAGNLSFAGKSFGMSVHLLPGTCTGFQQLLTGKAGWLPPGQVQLLPRLRLSPCSQASKETAFLSKAQKAKGSGTSVGPVWNLFQHSWVSRTAGSGSGCLHKGAGTCSAWTGTTESIK